MEFFFPQFKIFFSFCVVLVVYSGVSVFGNELVSSLFNFFFPTFFSRSVHLVSHSSVYIINLLSLFSVGSFLAPVA